MRLWPHSVPRPSWRCSIHHSHDSSILTDYDPPGMKRVELSQAKEDLSKLLVAARKEKILITRRGKPAGALIGFADDDERFEFELENDPRFLHRIAQARRSARAGKGRKLEDIP